MPQGDTPFQHSLLDRVLRKRETGLIAIILRANRHYSDPVHRDVFCIDLSVGSVTALAMVVVRWVFLAGVDPWAASAIAILVCTRIGAIMGFIVTRVGLHHFVVSAAIMVDCAGHLPAGQGGRPLGLFTQPTELKFIGQGGIGPVPVVILIFLVTVIVFDVLLRKIPMFRKVFNAGNNERAAAYSGIRTNKVIFLTTTLCSALYGVAGIIYMARFGSAQPAVWNRM